MKTVFFLFLFFSLGLCFAQNSKGLKKVEFFDEHQFPNLFKVGEKISLGNENSDKTQKINYIFRSARIGKVPKCVLSINTKNEKIYYYQVLTYDRKSSKFLYKMLVTELGKPIESSFGDYEKIFRWKSVNLGAGVSMCELVICDNSESEFRNWVVK